jgi:hypothetical protein
MAVFLVAGGGGRLFKLPAAMSEASPFPAAGN